MKITKFGQCCLLIETKGKRILTDPGRFTVSQNEVKDIDLILITHEHADHLHSESLQTILDNNPEAKVVTNTEVGKVLKELNVDFDLLEGNSEDIHQDIKLEAFDGKHVEIFGEYGIVQNTGYFIDETLFYPGDAYTNPEKSVPLLALPVGGPWCKVSDAINYALEVKPKSAFPVHDVLLTEAGMELTHNIVENQLSPKGVRFIKLKNNENFNFDENENA